MAAASDLPISQTYSRNSASYAPTSDLSMGMTSSQRPNAALAGPPSSYRIQQQQQQQQDMMNPNFAAPPSHMMSSSSRRDSGGGLVSPPISSATSSSRTPTAHGYSATSSPNMNRHSYTTGPAYTAPHPQPPRPVRSGTLPAGEHPGMLNGNHYRVDGRTASNGSTGPHSNGIGGGPGLSLPPVPSVGSMSSPLETSFDSKIGIGPTIPVQPEKDAVKDAPPTMRARSGTGKSTKDKKSVFGVLSGTLNQQDYLTRHAC